jgi:hypothetical protein
LDPLITAARDQAEAKDLDNNFNRIGQLGRPPLTPHFKAGCRDIGNSALAMIGIFSAALDWHGFANM